MGEPVEPRSISLLFQLFVLNQRVRGLLNRVMADAPLRPDEYAVYSFVWESRTVTPTAMARVLGMPLTTVSDYARTMIERGHARREGKPDDSRSYVLALTREGVRTHREAGRRFDGAMRAIRAELGEREGEVAAALEALTEAVSAVAAAGRRGRARARGTSSR